MNVQSGSLCRRVTRRGEEGPTCVLLVPARVCGNHPRAGKGQREAERKPPSGQIRKPRDSWALGRLTEALTGGK